MKKAEITDVGTARAIECAVLDYYLHLVRTNDGWKIANALWRST